MNRITVGIIGAGSHTRSLLNLIDKVIYDICGIFDNSWTSNSSEIICEIPLKGKISDIPECIKLILSIGDNQLRERYQQIFGERLIINNLIHKNALVENGVEIGKSNQIFANCYINTYAKIGNFNILNTGSIIEHETQIGSFNHISVGSLLCGRVTVGNKCFIGAGAVVIDKIKICDNVTLGANTVVIRDIIKPGVYVGNPAKQIK